jgi:hypothetical protein
MLAALPSTLVLSEPGPLDTILRARDLHPEVSEGDQVDWFRWMVAALGQNRPPGARYVIKLDAWATLSWRVIEQAFPGVPTVFVYRDPVEVLVSHLGRRGFHMIPGCLPPATLGLSSAEVLAMPPEEYLGNVLARLLEPAVERDEGALLVEYRELPEAVVDRIAPHFGVDVTEEDRAALRAVARRDAKDTTLPYLDDSGDKQRRASRNLRESADRWCRRYYDALEARRTGLGVGRR